MGGDAFMSLFVWHGVKFGFVTNCVVTFRVDWCALEIIFFRLFFVWSGWFGVFTYPKMVILDFWDSSLEFQNVREFQWHYLCTFFGGDYRSLLFNRIPYGQ